MKETVRNAFYDWMHTANVSHDNLQAFAKVSDPKIAPIRTTITRIRKDDFLCKKAQRRLKKVNKKRLYQ